MTPDKAPDHATPIEPVPDGDPSLVALRTREMILRHRVEADFRRLHATIERWSERQGLRIDR